MTDNPTAASDGRRRAMGSLPHAYRTDADTAGRGRQGPDWVSAAGPSRVGPMLGALLAVVILLALFPMRSMAANMLDGFRVNTIRTVPVTDAQLARSADVADRLDDLVRLEQVDGVPIDNVTVTSVPAPDVASAARSAGFMPRLPADLGTPVRVWVASGGDLEVSVNGSGLRGVAQLLGLDADGIPNETGRVTVHTAPGIEAEYDTESGPVVLRVVPAPTVMLPDGWDRNALGQVYLAALGFSGDEARAMAATIDWGSTLVIPVPARRARAYDVRVDGVYGVAFAGGRDLVPGPAHGRRMDTAPRAKAPIRRPGDAPESAAADPAPGDEFAALPAGSPIVLWEKDDYIYALGGSSEVSKLVAVAGGLR